MCAHLPRQLCVYAYVSLGHCPQWSRTLTGLNGREGYERRNIDASALFTLDTVVEGKTECPFSSVNENDDTRISSRRTVFFQFPDERNAINSSLLCEDGPTFHLMHLRPSIRVFVFSRAENAPSSSMIVGCLAARVAKCPSAPQTLSFSAVSWASRKKVLFLGSFARISLLLLGDVQSQDAQAQKRDYTRAARARRVGSSGTRRPPTSKTRRDSRLTEIHWRNDP